MSNIIPPDNRQVGDTGHVADHDHIADTLADHEAQLAGIPKIAFQTFAPTDTTVLWAVKPS